MPPTAALWEWLPLSAGVQQDDRPAARPAHMWTAHDQLLLGGSMRGNIRVSGLHHVKVRACLALRLPMASPDALTQNVLTGVLSGVAVRPAQQDLGIGWTSHAMSHLLGIVACALLLPCAIITCLSLFRACPIGQVRLVVHEGSPTVC